jgi:hypothetical protein
LGRITTCYAQGLGFVKTKQILCLYPRCQTYIVSMFHGSTTIDITHYTHWQILHSLFINYDKQKHNMIALLLNIQKLMVDQTSKLSQSNPNFFVFHIRISPQWFANHNSTPKSYNFFFLNFIYSLNMTLIW